MIRTHKPRGYAWTCASLFQQTPEFRNIEYEDCQVDDQTYDFGPSERAIKRQKVEKLADDFLNGHQLYISSARLPPQGIQHAVARSFARPKDARRAMAGIEVTVAKNSVWEDVQNQWEILRDYNHVDQDGGQVMQIEALEPEAGEEEEEVIVEGHAQASCTNHRQQKTIRFTIGPSDEALQQAAALRNCSLLRRSGRLSVPLIQRAQSVAIVNETQGNYSRSSHQATASDIGPTPTAAWTSSKWLNSGMFELRHKAVDEECSKDELGLSSLPIPSQKVVARPTVSLGRRRSALSQQSNGTTSGVRSVSGEALSSLDVAYRSSDSTHEHSDETTSAAHAPDPPCGDTGLESEELQEGSQAQLLRRLGVRATPRKSWASFGRIVESSTDSVALLRSPPYDELFLSPAIRASIQESARLKVGRSLTAKRATKSIGAVRSTAQVPNRRVSSRRKSAPSESQAAPQSTTGLPVDQQRRMGSFRAGENTYMSVPGKDSSPFIFRKRVSKFNNSDDPDIETLVVETRQRQDQSITPKRVEHTSGDPQLARTDPILRPAVADPKTPLVNQYLNRILPKTLHSGSYSSSVRKALHDEMRLAGAEFSSVEGDSQSSQVDDTAVDCELVTELAPEMPPPQAWPGTQVLLAEAQKDLFTSPNKENTTLYLGDKCTPQTSRDLPARRPLETLSQEQLPIPSTQALLDGWQGWSSIKKPRSAPGKRSSILPSPSVDRGSSNFSLVRLNPGNARSFGDAGLRRSSLRYSLSYHDSPDQNQTESLPAAAVFSAYESALNEDTSSTLFDSSIACGEAQAVKVSELVQPKPYRPSGATVSSATFSQGQFPATGAFNAVSSLSLHAGLSPQNYAARSQQQQLSSISFSPLMRPKPQRDESHPAPIQSPRVGLSTVLTEQGSWSFSPLAKPSNVEQEKDVTTNYSTPAAPLPQVQQAQDATGNDESGCILRAADMDSQELEFTLTDLVGEVLGSAKSGMPQGTGMFSQ